MLMKHSVGASHNVTFCRSFIQKSARDTPEHQKDLLKSIDRPSKLDLQHDSQTQVRL